MENEGIIFRMVRREKKKTTQETDIVLLYKVLCSDEHWKEVFVYWYVGKLTPTHKQSGQSVRSESMGCLLSFCIFQVPYIPTQPTNSLG